MKIKYLMLLTVSATVTAVDQLTKALIQIHFKLWEQMPVVPGFFDLNYAHNTGAAFSFLAGTSQNIRVPFFFIVPLVAMVVVLALFKATSDSDRLQIFALSLIFGGAIGNYIDRLRFRYVIDFLDFHWKDIYHYPSFNVADSAICVGVGLLVLEQFLVKNKKNTTAPTKAVT